MEKALGILGILNRGRSVVRLDQVTPSRNHDGEQKPQTQGRASDSTWSLVGSLSSSLNGPGWDMECETQNEMGSMGIIAL